MCSTCVRRARACVRACVALSKRSSDEGDGGRRDLSSCRMMSVECQYSDDGDRWCEYGHRSTPLLAAAHSTSKGGTRAHSSVARWCWLLDSPMRAAGGAADANQTKRAETASPARFRRAIPVEYRRYYGPRTPVDITTRKPVSSLFAVVVQSISDEERRLPMPAHGTPCQASSTQSLFLAIDHSLVVFLPPCTR